MVRLVSPRPGLEKVLSFLMPSKSDINRNMHSFVRVVTGSSDFTMVWASPVPGISITSV